MATHPGLGLRHERRRGTTTGTGAAQCTRRTLVLPYESLQEPDQHLLVDLALELLVRSECPESVILDWPVNARI